jgi:periplasmic copper chaperone A
MRRAIAGFGLIASLLAAPVAVGHEATSKGVTVAHPWARATPGGATVGVAFMEIKTAPDTADRLVSVSSPAAGRVEIHTHIKDGDVMKMRRVDSLDLEPGNSRVLKPSGEHIMMFDLKQPLKEGDLIKLTLVFEKAGAIEVEGSVERVGAKGPHGMDSQPASDEKSGGHEHMNHH